MSSPYSIYLKSLSDLPYALPDDRLITDTRFRLASGLHRGIPVRTCQAMAEELLWPDTRYVDWFSPILALFGAIYAERRGDWLMEVDGVSYARSVPEWLIESALANASGDTWAKFRTILRDRLSAAMQVAQVAAEAVPGTSLPELLERYHASSAPRVPALALVSLFEHYLPATRGMPSVLARSAAPISVILRSEECESISVRVEAVDETGLGGKSTEVTSSADRLSPALPSLFAQHDDLFRDSVDVALAGDEHKLAPLPRNVHLRWWLEPAGVSQHITGKSLGGAFSLAFASVMSRLAQTNSESGGRRRSR